MHAYIIHAALIVNGKIDTYPPPTIQEMEVSDNPTLSRDTSDPTLFCTAYKKNRFYLFTRKEPADAKRCMSTTVLD